MSSTHKPSLLAGLWQPTSGLKHLYYGSGCVEKNLLSTLPSQSSKAIIVTGTSLSTQTPLVTQLEELLGKRHAGTISHIRQHAPLEDLDRALPTVLDCDNLDTLISLGGGSPIDTAKLIAYRVKEERGTVLTHLTIPTTLSAAECTAGGGYVKPDGIKVGFRAPEMSVAAIFYDPRYAAYTPKELWLSTGMRAMDHAVECVYHPTAAIVPWKILSQWAVKELFECLPKARDSHPKDENVTLRLMLASFASSGLKGENIKGGMGLSHSLGYALGSPYGIPHGITSCMTLAKVVELKAYDKLENADHISYLTTAMGESPSGDSLQDALKCAQRIKHLVLSLGLEIRSLSARGISEDEIPVIASRALGGVNEGTLYDKVEQLVKTLF